MAFRKDIELETGATAKHWRIATLAIDYDEKALRVVVSGYLSKVAFTAGKAPLVTHAFSYNGDAFPLLSGQAQNIIQAVEAKVLLEPIFSGSVGD
jgi:hypothetical protein